MSDGSESSSDSSDSGSLISEDAEKRSRKIFKACGKFDVEKLRRISLLPGGFMTDELRQIAWPVVLGAVKEFPKEVIAADSKGDSDGASVSGFEEPDEWHKISWKDLKPHPDEEQVKKDTDRSFVGQMFPDGDKGLKRRQGELCDLICEVLRRSPYLHYFQGFHDICQVFYLVLDDNALCAGTPTLCVRTIAHLCNLRIRDFMLPAIETVQPHLTLINAIIHAADPALSAHINSAFRKNPKANTGYWAMPVTITMFSHHISNQGDISRLFDALLACEPAFGPYLLAALVISKRSALGMTGEEDPDDPLIDLDIADAMQIRLQNLARDSRNINVEELVALASNLKWRFPPWSPALHKAWSTVPACSCLKTAQNIKDAAQQTLVEGAKWWAQHNELMLKMRRRRERREMLNRTLRKIAPRSKSAKTLALLAVAGAITAYWMQKHPGTVSWVYQRVIGFGGAVFGPAGQ